MIPVRRVCTEDDLAKFQRSEAYKSIIGFIIDLNESVKGREIGLVEPVEPVIQRLLDICDSVSAAVDRHVPSESSSRFGKPEFRDFYDEVAKYAPQCIGQVVPDVDEQWYDELATYFSESWGNRNRIDYGSGHELNFLCFLLCLVKLGAVTSKCYANLVLGVFARYLKVMRKIQQSYWLEPAGSHGVWGLDDYHFLPFLFGSGQLVPHPYLRPISIHDEDMVEMYADKYFYFGCIKFIDSVKTASLRWHSPMLDDISGVKKWSKVNEGMIKMYRAEVLGKLPIVQHMLFGDLIPAPPGVTPAKDVRDEDIHIHCWADCCGIRVPSAIAAAAASSEGRSRGHVLQRAKAMPFD